MRTATRAAVGAVLVVGAMACRCAADTIEFISARRPLTDVTVLEEKLELVEYRLNGIQQKQTLESAEVASVLYEELPANLRAALAGLDSATSREQVLESAKALMGLIPNVKKRSLAAQVSLRCADALASGGDLDAALALFDRIVGDAPVTRYAPLALAAKGRWLAFRGDLELARAAFKKLDTFGGRFASESQLELASLEIGTASSPSVSVFDRIASEYQSKYPALSRLARIHRGRAEIALGKRDAALATFRSLIAERSSFSPAQQAAMWNGYGAALTASDSASAAELEEALYAHLRVITMFEAIVLEQPEALYRAGQCFLVVSSEDGATRSQDLLRRCQLEYPQTEWGKKAAKR